MAMEWDTCLDGLLHLVVELKDDQLGAIVAVRFDVFAFDDGEGFHDVLDGVARCGEHFAELRAVVAPFFGRTEVQMKVRGIQLAPQQKPTLLIPPKRRTVVTAVQRKRFQVPRRVCQFENASDYIRDYFSCSEGWIKNRKLDPDILA